jgi:hypothetical protein
MSLELKENICPPAAFARRLPANCKCSPYGAGQRACFDLATLVLESIAWDWRFDGFPTSAIK